MEGNTGATPRWRMIAEEVIKQIQMGLLMPGDKLPSEREASAQFHVARGTVREAYRYLIEQGLAVVSVGNGTIVSGGKSWITTKTAVFAEIEKLRRLFLRMDLNPWECQQIIEQEIWKRIPMPQRPLIIFLECNPELLLQVSLQIQEVCGLETRPFLLSQLLEDPVSVTTGADIVAIPYGHLGEVKGALAHFPHVTQIAMEISTETLNRFARIPKTSDIVLLYQSERFLNLQNRYLNDLQLNQRRRFCQADTELPVLFQQLDGVGAVILPPAFRSPLIEQLELLCRERNIHCIPFNFMLDQGSLLKLELDARRLWFSRHSMTHYGRGNNR